MEFLLLPLIVIADVITLAATWRSSASRLAKRIWSVAIVLLPLVGAGLWLLAGPKFRAAPDADGPPI